MELACDGGAPHSTAAFPGTGPGKRTELGPLSRFRPAISTTPTDRVGTAGGPPNNDRAANLWEQFHVNRFALFLWTRGWRVCVHAEEVISPGFGSGSSAGP